MVALRKDVKLGLTLGGIVLAVVGVYVGLTTLAGDPSTGNGNGASLQAQGAPANGAATSSLAGNTGSKQTTPPPTQIQTTPAPTNTTIADASKANNVPPVGPGSITPSAPINTPPSNGAASNDPWDTAFSSSGTPAVTETPKPGSVATNQRNSGPTASPSDIINQLQQPQGTPTTTTPPAGGSVASARDGSGSLLNNAGQTQLTQQGGSALPAAGETKHVVINGETLSTIAATYYGSSKYHQLIADANPNVNPNRLKIGQELRIPAKPATTEPSNTATASAPRPGNAVAGSAIDPKTQYVVKANDSLYKIASTLYGDSGQWERIFNANKQLIGNDPTKLKLGMVLTLPEPPTQR